MKSSKWGPWLSWFAVTLFYAYQYILRVVPSVLMTEISEKFSLTPDLFGQFSGIYYVGYSLAHIPVGIVIDRFGPKKVLPICILLTLSGILPLLFSGFWVFPILGRLLMGVGSSAAVLGLFKVVQLSFDRNKFSRILSLSVTVGLLGAIYGGGPVLLVKQALGFDLLIIALSLVGVALAFFSYIALPEYREKPSHLSVGKQISAVLADRRILLLALVAGLMVGPLEGFADVWGAQFLRVVYQLDVKIASSLPSFIFIGMCLGGPILCYFTEKSGKHLESVLLSAVVMSLGFGSIVLFRLDVLTLTILLFTMGIFCSYQILMIDKVSQIAKGDASGLATAIANMVIMIFGYVFHTVIGRLVGASGNFEDAQGLIQGISVIPGALAVSAVMLSLIFIARAVKIS